MKTSVIVPAGGIGQRFAGNVPKQFIEIGGAPVIIHTLRIFEEIEEVESIVVPVHSEWFSHTKELLKQYGIKKVKEVIVGGKERQDSVGNALTTKAIAESELVLVHDAVRPFVSTELVRKIMETAEEEGAAIPAVAPRDTVKEINSKGIVIKTLDRSKLSLVQTPQGYWTDIIKTAYTKASEASYFGTDSSELVEFIGYKVTAVEGEDSNIKITTPFDLKIAELIWQERTANIVNQ
ncbi:MAG: 2-C-methyl-D-erythritol 4-phosphate cytidylyltransferase [Chloroflexota bacterium]